MLFGRAEQLAKAQRALSEAGAGRGGTLVLSGEPGIGKSSLARQVASEAEALGARVGIGRSWEVGGAPAFWPWSQALSELGLDLDELLAGAAIGTAASQRIVAFDRIVRAVCGKKEATAPVVVILDDLHAADLASVELALAFARAALRKHALLIVTTRDQELLERREIGDLVSKLTRESIVMPLRRLDTSATASWLSSVGFDGDAVEVHRLSEGNPLFIEEAVRLGVDRFSTAAAGGVAVILTEHLSRISRETQEILSAASVFGREATPANVAALSERSLDEIDAAMREGRSAGVLSASSITFSHVLLRDALYDMLTPSRRQSLHARAGHLLEADDRFAALAVQHLLAAGTAVDAAQVVRRVCHAAEVAIARLAADSALEMIARARAELTGRMDEASALKLDLAELDARMQIAPSDEARTRAVECVARAKRLALPTEQAQAALIYSRERLKGMVDALMVKLLEEALTVLPDNERALRAQILARLAAALIPPTTDDANRRANEYAREALAIARELQDVPTLLHALAGATTAMVFVVPLAERLEITTELISLAREHGDELAYADSGPLQAFSLLESGRPMLGRREAEAYYRFMDSFPLPNLKWRATALRGMMAAFEKQLDETIRCADELRRLAAAGEMPMLMWICFDIGLCCTTNNAERFRALDHQITPLIVNSPIFKPWNACTQALIGNREAALANIMPLSECTKGLTAVVLYAQTAVFLQSAELAERFYEPLLQASRFGRFFGGTSGLFPIGSALRLLGELALLRGDRERARDHFDAAIVEAREIDSAFFLQLAQEGRERTGAKAEAKPRPTSPKADVTIAREGDVWVVMSGKAKPFRVKHSRGMEYLDHLLQNPGREIYVLALGGAGEAPEDAGVILDATAKQQYKQRVEDLEDQIDEAERNGDRGRASRAREELEALVEQLASAVGLGGRDRKAASNVERTRVNVQRRLKAALRNVAEHDATLGTYLEATIRTGTYCVYKPL